MSTMNPNHPDHDPVRYEELEGGAVWRVVLDRPKANILDGAMMRSLTGLFQRAGKTPRLCALLIEGAGDHFSFGASVQEHMPDQVRGMLTTFHALFRAAMRCAVPMVAAVRGQRLGGGLELASFCHRIVANPSAHLGQPEVKLGVFAPFASFFLPERIGRGAAEDLLLSGRSLGAEEALRIGLCEQIAEDPTAAGLHYVREHWLGLSAAALRHAVWAARLDVEQRFERQVGELERLYLEGTMGTEDAQEGLRAFLEKRAPRWSHR